MTTVTVGMIGRTEMLLAAGREILARGHRIGFVATCRTSGHEEADVDDFADFAREAGAPFLVGRELTSDAGLATLRKSGCAIGVSMNWLHLLPGAVLSAFPHGVFNAHPGDLPRYRGNACPNWAILQGEREAVLTVHRMSTELDAGPVAHKSAFDLEPDRTITDVYHWLRMAVPRAFGDLVDSVSAGSLVLRPQPDDPVLALRCYPRRPSDGRIAWDQTSRQIARLVRASGRPFAGAFTSLEGDRILRVWGSMPLKVQEPFLAVPGQVAFALDGDPVIATGEGYLRLTDVAFDGQGDSAEAKAVILKSLRNRLV